MNLREKERRRAKLGKALRRDLDRQAARKPGNAEFWKSLRVLGMVGWPIVLSAVGGAWLGRYLDRQFASGQTFTLMLLGSGLIFGCFVAWHAMKH